MVRVTNAPAANKARKRLLKLAKGFVGDRKNHIRLSADAVLSSLAFSYKHRKLRKRDFRSLWIMRMGVGAKINGISYSQLCNGLKKAGSLLNRKMLSEMAIHDPESFAEVVKVAKGALQ